VWGGRLLTDTCNARAAACGELRSWIVDELPDGAEANSIRLALPQEQGDGNCAPRCACNSCCVCGTDYGLREGHRKLNNFFNRRILSRLHVSEWELLMGAPPAARLDVKVLSPPASLAAAPATRLDAGEPLVQLDGNTLLSSDTLLRKHGLQFRGYILMCTVGSAVSAGCRLDPGVAATPSIAQVRTSTRLRPGWPMRRARSRCSTTPCEPRS
jgi:hypothetical protein